MVMIIAGNLNLCIDLYPGKNEIYRKGYFHYKSLWALKPELNR
jgi:hypothetical protein